MTEAAKNNVKKTEVFKIQCFKTFITPNVRNSFFLTIFANVNGNFAKLNICGELRLKKTKYILLLLSLSLFGQMVFSRGVVFGGFSAGVRHDTLSGVSVPDLVRGRRLVAASRLRPRPGKKPRAIPRAFPTPPACPSAVRLPSAPIRRRSPVWARRCFRPIRWRRTVWSASRFSTACISGNNEDWLIYVSAPQARLYLRERRREVSGRVT